MLLETAFLQVMAATHGNVHVLTKLHTFLQLLNVSLLPLSLSPHSVGVLMVDMFSAQRGHALILALCIQTQALAEVLFHVISMTKAKAAVGLSPMEDAKEMATGSRPLKTA